MITVTDTSIGPAIDMHTHVALAYVRPMSVDMTATGEVEHYLPGCCAIDLDARGHVVDRVAGMAQGTQKPVGQDTIVFGNQDAHAVSFDALAALSAALSAARFHSLAFLIGIVESREDCRGLNCTDIQLLEIIRR